MLKSINEPYVRSYENGILVNPLKGGYQTEGPNRASRRSGFKNKKRLLNNRGNHAVTTFRDPDEPFKIRKATIIVRNGLLHYISK